MFVSDELLMSRPENVSETWLLSRTVNSVLLRFKEETSYLAMVAPYAESGVKSIEP